ncbi:DUF4270 domain-containing protein [Tamlana sp. 62-3]|uniref:DUF4270 domain-containing protein n=1 Tax=Neotamlana sargassicola TaxID=2883125 RepID=A0A9X1I8Y1_9FLAO|nr:DUF4270 family protein [Tamlana sargassicola]MCB4809457.1 DUF4270 domain-containing protein [Tamlana sargassicola]
MRLFLVSGLIFLLALSCSEEVSNYPVGTNFVDSDINITIMDTFSIKAGTFRLDSLITSSSSRILIGSEYDDNFGQVKAQSYFQLNPASFTISDDAVYDSIGLVLHYDNYYHGDTTKLQTYRVHRVTEYFEPVDDAYAFYNLSELSYNAEPLGEASFIPRPNTTTDSIYIPLDYNVGLEIFEQIRDNEIISSDEFFQYFYGVTVIPDYTANAHVLGFKFSSDETIDDNSGMRIFYTEDTDDTSADNDKQFSFYVSTEADQFNAIDADLESTLINYFDDSETIISSEDTNNKIFTQAGLGICARIEMPTLRDLNAISDNSNVLKAELTFYPEIIDSDSKSELPDTFEVYVVDHKNRIVTQLTDIDGNTAYAVLSGDDDEFNQNTYYTIDMSGFVQTVLASETDLNYALMIQFADYDKIVDNVVIKTTDDEGHPNINLAVTYLNY